MSVVTGPCILCSAWRIVNGVCNNRISMYQRGNSDESRRLLGGKLVVTRSGPIIRDFRLSRAGIGTPCIHCVSARANPGNSIVSGCSLHLIRPGRGTVPANNLRAVRRAVTILLHRHVSNCVSYSPFNYHANFRLLA